MVMDQVGNPDELRARANRAVGEAFVRLRYFWLMPINEAGKEYLYLIADAAHDIPGMIFPKAELDTEYLERRVAELEALVHVPLQDVIDKYIEWRRRRFFARVWKAIRSDGYQTY